MKVVTEESITFDSLKIGDTFLFLRSEKICIKTDVYSYIYYTSGVWSSRSDTTMSKSKVTKLNATLHVEK